MEVTQANYFTSPIQAEYFSVSQFKAFERCEAEALAEMQGNYEPEETKALLVGSYVDAYFEGTLDAFIDEHPDIFNSRTGELKADYRQADEIIKVIEAQPLLMEYLQGEKQVIMTGELFGHKWKIKMDVYVPNERIVDLKIVKDLSDIYDSGYGWRSWIEHWGYDLQGAVYQRIEQASTGRAEPLPFYIAVATKERVPDVDLIHIPQHILDAALKAHGVEAKIDRFALIKSGDVDPIRCGECDYCKSTKVIEQPTEYEIKEAL